MIEIIASFVDLDFLNLLCELLRICVSRNVTNCLIRLRQNRNKGNWLVVIYVIYKSTYA